MSETKGCQVLVVSDFACLEWFITNTLASRGRGSDQVRLAHGGREGLALAEQNPPDLIITDLWMLDMDGYEFCRQLKTVQALRNVPVLLQSSVSPTIVYPEAQRAGAAGYLHRLDDTSDLVVARDAVLNSQTYYPPGPYQRRDWERALDEKGCRVLIMDDNCELVVLDEMILGGGRNDQVRYAENGRKGLAAAEQDPPDFIILDIMMPELDGWEVHAQLKATPTLADIPVLFQAGMPSSHAYPLVKQAGAQGYLCEPYGSQDLLAARDAVLRGETYYPPI